MFYCRRVSFLSLEFEFFKCPISKPVWQSGQKPGSFPRELRFKFQQFMAKASKLWLKHTVYKLMNLKWLLITTSSYHIQGFHTLVQTNVITHWLYLLSTAGESECVSVQILPLREKGLFGVLWGPCWSYPQFDLARFLSYILVMTYPKIIFPALLVSEEIGVKVFRYFFALSYIR